MTGLPITLQNLDIPKWKSHKIVGAAKIKQIIDGSSGETTLICHDPERQIYSFVVDQRYMAKHMPEVGGYYVVYQDGYQSFSPAKAFEEGYTLID